MLFLDDTKRYQNSIPSAIRIPATTPNRAWRRVARLGKVASQNDSNWGSDDDYDKGEGFGHIAIGVPDIYGLCEMLEKEGVEIPRPVGPLKHGGPNASVIAFVKDPDGDMIELGERA